MIYLIFRIIIIMIALYTFLVNLKKSTINHHDPQKQQKKYVYIVEWFDIRTSLSKKFHFTYHLATHQIEIYDFINSTIFLKKIKYPQIKVDKLYIGSVLNCFNRQLKIIDYADQFTRLQRQNIFSSTYGMIKPNAYLNIGKIIKRTQQIFEIANIKMFKLTVADAQIFYAQHKQKRFFPTLIQFMTSNFSVGMQLLAPDAISKWRQLIGPTNSIVAKQKAPTSLRALYGVDGTKNACHGSDAPETAKKQLKFIFQKQSGLKSYALLKNCILCVIKPHAIKNKNVGEIIDIILTAGFQINALQMFWLDKDTAKNFFDIYKYQPQYTQIVDHFLSGPCIALEVRRKNAVVTFGQLCGPSDPQLARKQRPNSIRARFGQDNVKNAVHYTNLEQNGPIEVHYFFQTLANV